MTEISSDAKKTLLRLIRYFHKQGMSYRKMASLITRTDKDGKPILTGQTIGRIAKSKGKWFPKSERILLVLGVLEQSREKKISEMSSKELLWRLENRSKYETP